MNRFVRILAPVMFLAPVMSAYALATSPEDTLKQLILLVTQYESQIKTLQAENSLLREEVSKAGIKIPLSAFSGVINQSQISTISSTYLTGILATQTGSSSLISQSTGTTSTNTTQTGSSVASYGTDKAGFITRIHKDWTNIIGAYNLPTNAVIGGYEFVQNVSQDHVFVDVVYGTGMGYYDAKILYQFDKTEYKRKLIGLFMFDTSTQRYITKTGSNPFAGVSRVFIRDPYFVGVGGVPPTATVYSSGVTTSVTPSLPTTTTTTTSSGTTVNVQPSSVTYADIDKAYGEKKYLSVISLSNSYLTTNPATFEILKIRYRTYFIIGKYTESLAEIKKIEALGKMDKQTSCDAQVIAAYTKDTTLVSKYTTLCKAS